MNFINSTNYYLVWRLIDISLMLFFLNILIFQCVLLKRNCESTSILLWRRKCRETSILLWRSKWREKSITTEKQVAGDRVFYWEASGGNYTTLDRDYTTLGGDYTTLDGDMDRAGEDGKVRFFNILNIPRLFLAQVEG